MSDESGQPEIYVRSFPEGGSRIQISVGGGTRPVWSRDGKALYYREGSRMVAATLVRDPALRAASRQMLFDGPYDREFDVSPDGSRFLMIETKSSGMSLIVIPNWLTELHQLTTKPAR
jgi:serine/threonine-protein kinase